MTCPPDLALSESVKYLIRFSQLDPLPETKIAIFIIATSYFRLRNYEIIPKPPRKSAVF